MNTNEVCKQFLLYCQQNKQLSYHTIEAYKQDLGVFNKFTKAINICNYEKQQLKDYFVYLNQQGYAKKTIKRRIACLKSMFRWLELEEIIASNPFNKVDLSIKLARQLPRNIQKSDLKKILMTAKNQLGIKQNSNYELDDFKPLVKTPKDFNLLTSLIVVELLFSTGMRVGELVNIDISNIQIKESRIKIVGKGLRERFVFITDEEIANLLKSYIHLREVVKPIDNKLIINSRGKQASTHFIRKLLRLTSKKAQINKPITPHMYRHSAACQLLESGLDIRYVQRLLGHQSISTTELYTHVNNNVLLNKICQANVRGELV